MGTLYQVKVARGELSGERRRELDEAIRAELDAVDAAMSTYREDSELSRFNRYAGPAPFELSDATWEVLQAALEVSRHSEGALDPTVGPLVDAWGFGPGGAPPDDSPIPEGELAVLLERIGYRKLELLEEPRAVRKARADLHCDLSAVAKGYAVDRVAEALERLGEEDFMAEVGGEVRALGTNERGEPWRIGIERPQPGRGAVQRIVPLDAMSLATSGDYRNYREVGGERVSHILDPRTGRPIRHLLVSVSVAHPSCTMADAWATALMVLGEREGPETAERLDLAAFFLVRDGDGHRELATPAFEELLAAEEP